MDSSLLYSQGFFLVISRASLTGILGIFIVPLSGLLIGVFWRRCPWYFFSALRSVLGGTPSVSAALVSGRVRSNLFPSSAMCLISCSGRLNLEASLMLRIFAETDFSVRFSFFAISLRRTFSLTKSFRIDSSSFVHRLCDFTSCLCIVLFPSLLMCKVAYQ